MVWHGEGWALLCDIVQDMRHEDDSHFFFVIVDLKSQEFKILILHPRFLLNPNFSFSYIQDFTNLRVH